MSHIKHLATIAWLEYKRQNVFGFRATASEEDGSLWDPGSNNTAAEPIVSIQINGGDEPKTIESLIPENPEQQVIWTHVRSVMKEAGSKYHNAIESVSFGNDNVEEEDTFAQWGVEDGATLTVSIRPKNETVGMRAMNKILEGMGMSDLIDEVTHWRISVHGPGPSKEIPQNIIDFYDKLIAGGVTRPTIYNPARKAPGLQHLPVEDGYSVMFQGGEQKDTKIVYEIIDQHTFPTDCKVELDGWLAEERSRRKAAATGVESILSLMDHIIERDASSQRHGERTKVVS